MQNQERPFVDRMSGRSGDSEAVETDLPFSERLAKYRNAEEELARAQGALETGPRAEEGSRQDVKEAASILEGSAQHHAHSLTTSEIDGAVKDGAISNDEAAQIYQRSMAHRMNAARADMDADAQSREGPSLADDQTHER